MVSSLTLSTAPALISTSVVDYLAYEDLIHSIRTDVFVREQRIPLEQESDRDDPLSQHVLAFYRGLAIGTGRLTPAGRIGRVAVARPVRRRGVGACIMRQLMDLAKQSHHREVVLSAQYHAIRFYEKLGFQTEGEVFMDFEIPHVMMRKRFARERFIF